MGVLPVKVLIVDDEVLGVEALTLILQREGHEVLVAYDAPDGVAIALAEHPDLVIMDVTMPGAYDGLEGVRRLRTAPGFRGIVVCQTALQEGADARRDPEAGPHHWLHKPFRRADLLALLARLGSGRESEPGQQM